MLSLTLFVSFAKVFYLPKHQSLVQLAQVPLTRFLANFLVKRASSVYMMQCGRCYSHTFPTMHIYVFDLSRMQF